MPCTIFVYFHIFMLSFVHRHSPRSFSIFLGAQGEKFSRGSESSIELGSGLQQAGAVAAVLRGTLNGGGGINLFRIYIGTHI